MKRETYLVLVLCVLGAALAFPGRAPEADARRKRPSARPAPRPTPTPQFLTVRCGPDIGAVRSDAVLTFGEQQFVVNSIRSVSLVKRERFTGLRANDKCCETEVTTEGAVQNKGGKRIPVSGRTQLELQIGKSTKTCTIEVSADQVSSYRCYPDVIVQCPKISDSKVEMILMVF